MTCRKLIAGAAVVALCLAASGAAAGAARKAAPKRTTIKVSQSFKLKPNRYVQDGLRWNRDVYTVRSGGTLHIVNTAAGEGPHTFTVMRRKDIPKTAAKAFNCKPCNKLVVAHGADPNSESDAPPKFQFLENGVGQDTPPNVDRPGDSGITGEGKKGESIDLKVTAPKGKKLYFMCLVHPWMQARVDVK